MKIILTNTVEPARFTHVMYRSNLNHRSLGRHLGEMQRLGLVRTEGPCWQATTLGREMLRRMRAVDTLWEEASAAPVGELDPSQMVPSERELQAGA